MKYIRNISLLLSFVQLFSIANCGISTEYSKACPEECIPSINACLIELDIKGSYVPYPPPNSDLGKCYCKSMDAYFNCLKCYETKKPLEVKSPFYKAEIEANCKKYNFPMNVDANNTTATDNTQNKTEKAKATDSNKPELKVDSTKDNNKEKDNKNNGGSTGLIIIGVVAAAGIIGFIVYTRKQKRRPESMPFFGNSATSPNQYATLNTPKEMSMTDSTNNLTTDYSNQYFSDMSNPTVPSSDSYYGQSTNYSGYNQQNQYDSGYQNYSNQYPTTSYENDVVGNSAYAAPPPASISTNIESRRESMMPNSQPTAVNFSGVYVVAYKYEPQLDDELELQVNDQVQIIEEYEDGWMKATNLTTGKEGMAPRVCIKEA